MSFKNADVWIQTGVLWCRKRQVCQLPHNQLHVAVVCSATAVVIVAAVIIAVVPIAAVVASAIAVADPVVIAVAAGVVIIAVTAVVGVAATVINCCCYHVVLFVNYPPLKLESSVLPIRNYFEKQRCKKLKQ